MPQSEVDPALHERLGRALGSEFEVLGLLGRGGFADVYEIRERKLDRSLAVKVLRPEISWGPWMVSRFEREARALASLNHLNIPPIHFVGENEGLVYYVMPLIAGVSLGDRLAAGGPFAPGEVVNIMIPVLDALHHAHNLGIVHRDIKPDNIVLELETERPLLVDFGVAKQLKVERAGSSLPGAVFGTPGYISPEQAAGGEELDGRSDIYAVGATMYHLLTGTTAFGGPPPDELNPAIPAWLSDVVMQALAAEPWDRFASAGAMAEALRAGRQPRRASADREPTPVERIRSSDPTPTMVEVSSGSTPAVLQRRSGPRRQPRRARSSRLAPLLLLLAAGTAAAWFLLVPVQLELRNNLLVPVEVTTADNAPRTIPPGQAASFPLSQGRMMGRWFVVQPPPEESTAPHETVTGMIRIEGLTVPEMIRRSASRSIDSWADGSVIYAPRIENSGVLPVRVSVRGTNGQGLCNCLVPPGETRLLGYFRLDPNSAIQLSAAGGRSAEFRNLESRIDLNTGLLQLNVNDTTLSRHPQ